MDISIEQQEGFSSGLREKYGCQFSEDGDFKKYVSEAFALQKDKGHVLKLTYVEIQELLKEPSIEQSSHPFGFYAKAVDRLFR